MSVLLILFMFTPCVLHPMPQFEELRNEWIWVKVYKKNTRLVIGTVKGDPDNPADDNVLITYPHDFRAPPSFASFELDGMRFRQDEKPFERIKDVTKEGNSITVSWMLRNVKFLQRISIATNPISKRVDAIKIFYRMDNEDNDLHNVGLRFMVDTYIKDKDGVVFDVPSFGLVTNETLLRIREIPSYFMILDDVSNPLVKLMVILKGKGLKTPDKLIFANQKSLTFSVWDPPLTPGKSFKRNFVSEKDSAFALFYNLYPILPGGYTTFTIYYGVYGPRRIDENPIFLSAEPPDIIPPGSTFRLPVDIENLGTEDLENTELFISLPPVLRLTKGSLSTNIGYIKKGFFRKLNYSLTASEELPYETYEMRLEARARYLGIPITNTLLLPLNIEIPNTNKGLSRKPEIIRPKLPLLSVPNFDELNLVIKRLSSELRDTDYDVDEIYLHYRRAPESLIREYEP